MKRYLKNHINPATFFFLLTALLHLIFIPVYLHYTNFWTDVLVSFGPSIAGVISTFIYYERDGLVSLLRKCLLWKIHPLWYLAVCIVPTIAFITTVQNPEFAHSWFKSLPILFYALLLKTFLGGGLGEELGWRGFALPELLKKMNFFQANLLIGVFWGVWHFPAVYFFNKPNEIYFLYLLYCASMSFLIGWMHQKTNGSIFLCILFHASLNVPGAFSVLLK